MMSHRNHVHFHWIGLFVAILLCIALPAHAEDDRFDLSGPTMRITVTRGGATLPIAQVPNLLPGDRLEITPEFPQTQLNHLLVIVAFLRGSTNEPPDNWFTKIEPWKLAGQQSTIVSVPAGAQSALIFVAPETGGDFVSLRSVVKRTPGVFARASASLFKLSLEQQRTERYLAGMQSVAHEDNVVVAHRSASLASALLLKPNADCFKQPVEDQVDCLTQTSDAMLLDNGSQQTTSATISTGASSDFINEASQNDGGVYSAYVGTVVDLVHLLGLLHTAQYRYIPAITLPDGSDLKTRLNAAPSFSNPKSVIVIPMPPVRASRLPDLHLVDPDKIFCLRNPAMMLPLRGSSILYSTAYPHDLVLRFEAHGVRYVLPVTADVVAGGLVSDSLSNFVASLGQNSVGIVHATLHGRWGFDAFDGPGLTFQNREGTGWSVVDGDSLGVGVSSVRIASDAMACVNRVLISQDGQTPATVAFVSSDDDRSAAITLTSQEQKAGQYSLHVFQYGTSSPIVLSFAIHPDSGAHVDHAHVTKHGAGLALVGHGLSELLSASIDGGGLVVPANAGDANVSLEVPTGLTAKPGEQLHVAFRDGRMQTIPLEPEDDAVVLSVVSLQASVEFARGELPVELQTPGAIPLHSTLHFAVSTPSEFAVTDRLEVASKSGGESTMLGFKSPNPSLILENTHVAVASLDLDVALGESAFGPLQTRLIRANGEMGEWVPLGTVVRRPTVTNVHCIHGQCELRGRELFLIEAISTTEDFKDATTIPVTEIGDTVSFQTGNATPYALYVRLRDNLASVARVALQRD